MTELLEEFRNEAKDVVGKACRLSLNAAGFTPDDQTYKGRKGEKNFNRSDVMAF